MKLINKIADRLLITAIVLLVAAAASAQSSPDARTHDGFYLRMSVGGQIAGFSRGVKAESSAYGYEGDSQVRGGGGMLELSLGGTPTTGLVLGGSIFTGNIAGPTIEHDDDDIEDIELDDNLNFAMWGFLVDYYFDETSGFHLGGTIGGAVVGAALPDESVFEFIGGWGWAVSLATGYDWWVANQWSLGVLGRLIYAGVTGEDTEEGIKAEENSGYLAFGILFTAVYH